MKKLLSLLVLGMFLGGVSMAPVFAAAVSPANADFSNAPQETLKNGKNGAEAGFKKDDKNAPGFKKDDKNAQKDGFKKNDKNSPKDKLKKDKKNDKKAFKKDGRNKSKDGFKKDGKNFNGGFGNGEAKNGGFKGGLKDGGIKK